MARTMHLQNLFDELDARLTGGQLVHFSCTYGPGGPRITVRNADDTDTVAVIVRGRGPYFRLIDDDGEALVPVTDDGITTIVQRLTPAAA